MTDKKPFDKNHSTKIPFSELVELIGKHCDYKFAIFQEREKPPIRRLKSVMAEGIMPKPVPYVLIIRCFSIRFRDQLFAKIQHFHKTQTTFTKKHRKNVLITPKITIFVLLINESREVGCGRFRVPRLAVPRQMKINN